MKIKASEAVGDVLDCLVAMAAGHATFVLGDCEYSLKDSTVWQRGCASPRPFRPSRDWSEGGPILEMAGIELKRGFGKPLLWAAFAYDWSYNCLSSSGKTGGSPLIAAMRCFVAVRLGQEIEVPDWLLEGCTA